MEMIFQFVLALQVYYLLKICKRYSLVPSKANSSNIEGRSGYIKLKKGVILVFLYSAGVAVSWPLVTQLCGCEMSINSFYILYGVTDLTDFMVMLNIFALDFPLAMILTAITLLKLLWTDFVEEVKTAMKEV